VGGDLRGYAYKHGPFLNPFFFCNCVYFSRTSKEHRENLAKQAKAAFVECKKHMDRIVDNNNKEVKKQESISKDEVLRVGTLVSSS